jgi:hypothetical protein
MEIKIIFNNSSYDECFDFNNDYWTDIFYSVIRINNIAYCFYIDEMDSDFIITSFIVHKINLEKYSFVGEDIIKFNEFYYE